MNSTRPPGPPVDHTDHASPLPGVAALILALSTTFVAMRFWSRSVILRTTKLEDWFLLFGWMCAVGTTACILAQKELGLGRDFRTLSSGTVQEFFKLGLAINGIYVICLTAVKVSILCLYYRVLKYDRIRLAAKVIMAIVIVSHVYIIVSVFTVCVPLEAFWDFSKRRPGTYCHPYAVYWSHAGINIGTDFMIFALPLPVLRKIRVPTAQKRAVYGVFLLAFGVCVISLARALHLVNKDILSPRDMATMGYLNILEVHFAVICGCLTTIKPLLARIFPNLFSTLEVSDESPQAETIGRVRRRHNPHDIAMTDRSTAVASTAKDSGYTSVDTEGIGIGTAHNEPGIHLTANSVAEKGPAV